MSTQQPILHQGNSWRIYWYDEQQTIIVCEIFTYWTWVDASEGLMHLNETTRSVSNGVDVILWFMTEQARSIPKGIAFSTLRALMMDDVPNENAVIMVNAHRYFETLLTTVKKTYSLFGSTSPYYYVSDFETALTSITTQRENPNLNESV